MIPDHIQDWPDLTYHYGISPRELAYLPPWLLNHYRVELPRIIAQAQSRLIQGTTFPHMKRASQSSIMHGLRNSSQVRRSGRRPRSKDEFLGMIAMSGIGFTKEPPGGGGD